MSSSNFALSILQLKQQLAQLITSNIQISCMIWGPPGIGKSSVVKQIAEENGMQCIDLRISQLAPTDLRGLPVAKDGISTWYPPEFLPKDGSGILFLDEFNMAVPAVMGIAQQLILDRKVGNYTVPKGWFIWAAGNTAKDKAAVYKMPDPLTNRFLHFSLQLELNDFKAYAYQTGIADEIIAFLNFRTELLHKPNQEHAWPSPRSWEFASQLLSAQLPTESAIGIGAAVEFEAFRTLYQNLPNLTPILEGNGDGIQFPSEISTQFAMSSGLIQQILDANSGINALKWMLEKSSKEFLNLFLRDFLLKLNTFPPQERTKLLQSITQQAELKLELAKMAQKKVNVTSIFE